MSITENKLLAECLPLLSCIGRSQPPNVILIFRYLENLSNSLTCFARAREQNDKRFSEPKLARSFEYRAKRFSKTSQYFTRENSHTNRLALLKKHKL